MRNIYRYIYIYNLRTLLAIDKVIGWPLARPQLLLFIALCFRLFFVLWGVGCTRLLYQNTLWNLARCKCAKWVMRTCWRCNFLLLLLLLLATSPALDSITWPGLGLAVAHAQNFEGTLGAGRFWKWQHWQRCCWWRGQRHWPRLDVSACHAWLCAH